MVTLQPVENQTMINERQYQEILVPFKNANIMFPPTLQDFVSFTRRELDPDQTDLEQMLSIMNTLMLINVNIYLKEVNAIADKLSKMCLCEKLNSVL